MGAVTQDILAAAAIDNVNIRGNAIEQLLTRKIHEVVVSVA